MKPTQPTITKVDGTTISISTPQPDKVVTVPLKTLYARQTSLQTQLSTLNDQIAQAEALGVVQAVQAVNSLSEQSVT